MYGHCSVCGSIYGSTGKVVNGKLIIYEPCEHIKPKPKMYLDNKISKAGPGEKKSDMSDIDPEMLHTNQLTVSYEQEYHCKVFTGETFFRLIVVERHSNKYRWEVWKSHDTNSSPNCVKCSGINYDYNDPNHALVDAKKYVNLEIEAARK